MTDCTFTNALYTRNLATGVRLDVNSSCYRDDLFEPTLRKDFGQVRTQQYMYRRLLISSSLLI